MLREHPLVSVIIPTHYRNEMLRDCIDSVVNQIYDNVEIIVVDDSGERHASDVVSEFNEIIYIPFEKNMGPNAARNAGIQISSGQYVQLLDDDDCINQEKLQEQLAVFKRNSEIGVVYCGGRSDAVGMFSPRPEGRGDVLRLALQFELPSCVTSTMLIRRDIVDAVYPLPDVPGSDDTYWKIEFAQLCLFDYVNKQLVNKKAPTVRRGESQGAVDGTWRILDQYDHLYSDFDDNVRKIAESKALKREAQYLLRTSQYSTNAIRLFYQAIRRHPNPSMTWYFGFISCLFGRYGYLWARAGYQKMFS